MDKKKLLNLIISSIQIRHYISRVEIDCICEYVHHKCKPETLNRYLADWRNENALYAAGRGWYSDLTEEFVLYCEPLEELNGFMMESFPLLEFVCWSTKQLTNFYHNLPGKFYTFVYVDRFAMQEVAEKLHKKYPLSAILVNPGKSVLRNFLPQNNNIVIRPIIYDDRKYAALDACLHIENILVDLAIETEALSLMDGKEYSGILNNVATSGRIKPGVALRRIMRRRAKNDYTAILLKYFQPEYKKSTNVNF